MNPVLGIDYRPWKCHNCKKKYKGVYKLCHYWKDSVGFKSLMKRTCYKCGYIRPILKSTFKSLIDDNVGPSGAVNLS